MYLYPLNSFGFSEIAKTSKIFPSSSFKRASLSSGNSSLTAGISPSSNGFSSSVTTDSSGFTPPSNGFSSSVTTDSSGFTPPSNGFNSIVGTFSSDLDVTTSELSFW